MNLSLVDVKRLFLGIYSQESAVSSCVLWGQPVAAGCTHGSFSIQEMCHSDGRTDTEFLELQVAEVRRIDDRIVHRVNEKPLTHWLQTLQEGDSQRNRRTSFNRFLRWAEEDAAPTMAGLLLNEQNIRSRPLTGLLLRSAVAAEGGSWIQLGAAISAKPLFPQRNSLGGNGLRGGFRWNGHCS